MDGPDQIGATERRRESQDATALAHAMDRTTAYVAGLRRELMPLPADAPAVSTIAAQQRAIDESFSQLVACDESEPGRDYWE